MPIVQDILDEKTFDNEFAGNKDFFEGINRINENDIVFPKLKCNSQRLSKIWVQMAKVSNR